MICNFAYGLYEYGIFSTFLLGNEIPGNFSHKSSDGSSSICFTVPSLPNLRIRGLNFFVVYANSENGPPSVFDDHLPTALITKVRNKSKGRTWIYGPRSYGIPGAGEDMIWLSHWSFLENQFKGGDQVDVSVSIEPQRHVKEWGMKLVIEEQQRHMTSSSSTSEDPCDGDMSRREVLPGIYLFC